ncbi:heavy-metal-associated domain-containing protein [Olsenella sp. YH-ols2217]|uniref:Heavy-metal-associated domain-containing protein n=1 Tax=Kribbibacterium absianum TaxID=3044210 RepID=A0ABT6ZJU3_9ACTN|nr:MULTISPECIES: heavy-metal-associated domain-containing protein [unclassified Olsenella]MDJ1122446.1 heavy-metal-associated domain-containing protein [Olsenella sp. YH-ols2216]MDJ1129300.1 heavy-metal-associated domain-containing protein [Olsenella sp. YH-ols2217]
MQTHHVNGMHCKHCEMLVVMELEDRGAKDVRADHETGVVEFEGDLTPEQVAEAIAAAGFELAD